MKDTSSNEKTSSSQTNDAAQNAFAGLEGIAIAPPAYGIERVDSLSAQAAPIQRMAGESAAGGEAGSPPPNHTGLPDALKSGVESLSGFSLNDVRVHYNSPKPAGLNALAYTQGTDIHVGPRQERHLPHEAWHVVQQKQGRVKAIRQMKGMAINDNSALEKEADVMGAMGLRSGAKPQSSQVEGQSALASTNVLQRMALYPNAIANMDRIICADLALQHNRAGGDAYDWPGFSSQGDQSLSLGGGEGLILVGHGEPGEIEGKDGPTLATKLRAKVTNVTSAKYIFISACNSAADVGDGTTLASSLATSLGIDGAKVLGAEGYKVNNLDDESIESAVYSIEKAQGTLASGISAGLAAAYQVSLYEKGIANDVEEAEAIGTDLIKVTSNFFKFMQAFAKAMSGDAAQIESVKSDLRHLVSPRAKIFTLLDQAKAKPIAKTMMRTGTLERRMTSLENILKDVDLDDETDTTPPVKTEDTAPKSSDKQSDQQSDQQSGSSGLCFITTACTQAKGLPDDCLELTTLRAFRDEYMMGLAKGREMVKVYYENSPAIVEAINAREDVPQIYDELYEIICHCVRDVQNEEYERAFQTYVQMVIELRNRFTPLATVPAFFYHAYQPEM